MQYSPRSSVTALRTFSISTGLDASTVTPGRTPPDPSVTTPAMLAALVPWAFAAKGSDAASTNATRIRTTTGLLIVHLTAVTTHPGIIDIVTTERRGEERLILHLPVSPHTDFVGGLSG